MSITSESANYKSTTEYSSKYKYVNLALNNMSGNTVTLGNTSTQQIDFLLPSNCVYNLSKSILEYDITVPAIALSALYTWTFEDTFTLANIVQLDVGAVSLVNLQFAQNFQKLNHYLTTTPEELNYQDPTSGFYTAINADAHDINYLPVGIAGGTNTCAMTLPQIIMPHASVAATVKYVRYELGRFHNTYLGMDINSLFNQQTYLRFFVGMPNKMAFSGSSNTIPATAATTLPGAAVIIKNIRLKLAIETNEDINNELRKKMASGTLSYNFPNVLTFRNPSTGTNANINININSTMGSKLKDIYHMPFSVVESLNTAYDHSNYDGSKIVSYNTFLNSVQIQSGGVLSCLQPDGVNINSDDYRENMRYFNKGKTVLHSMIAYKINWFHNEKFYEPTHLNISQDKLDHGISLINNPIQWGFQATTAADLTHYTYMVFIKELTVTPDTITVQ